MINSKMFYEKMEEKFVSWAQTVEDIRAAFIVGSRARTDHPADEWSDMDIIIFSTKPNFYLSNKEWLNNMGELWTSFVSQTAGGDFECLTLFEGGWQVDFVIDSVDNLKQMVESKTIPDNFHRGVRVIIDKDRVSQHIMPKYCKAPKSLTLSEDLFLQYANMFWFIALYMAKQILRNDLWVVKVRDGNLKEILLQMIEWHEKMKNGSEYDTWHAGRFVCEWASEDTQVELNNSFGHFDRSDSWKALMATITLFKRLSHDIAQKMNYSYPYDLETNIRKWLSEKSNLFT